MTTTLLVLLLCVAEPHKTMSPEELQQRWQELKSDDAALAYRAIWALRQAGPEVDTFLGQHLKAAAPVNEKQVTQWIAELDSPRFAVREKATTELNKLGERAERALRAALEGKPSLEMRRRIEEILKSLPAPTGETLRSLRAIEVLEYRATPVAREHLQRLAKGAEARVTTEAKAALARLGRLTPDR